MTIHATVVTPEATFRVLGIDASTPLGIRLAREHAQADAPETLIDVVATAIDSKVTLHVQRTGWKKWIRFNPRHVERVESESFD
jgi:hypothetical protein